MMQGLDLNDDARRDRKQRTPGPETVVLRLKLQTGKASSLCHVAFCKHSHEHGLQQLPFVTEAT